MNAVPDPDTSKSTRQCEQRGKQLLSVIDPFCVHFLISDESSMTGYEENLG